MCPAVIRGNGGDGLDKRGGTMRVLESQLGTNAATELVPPAATCTYVKSSAGKKSYVSRCADVRTDTKVSAIPSSNCAFSGLLF
jgi:hypothetical protein